MWQFMGMLFAKEPELSGLSSYKQKKLDQWITLHITDYSSQHQKDSDMIIFFRLNYTYSLA